MPKKLTLMALALMLNTTFQLPSWAGNVLDKIKQTGIMTAGTRKDAIPFGYINEQGQWVGYSIDILEIIRQDIQQKLGKLIELQLVEVTPQNRFAKIKEGSIDIECASTTFTWEREKEVDFTVSYFASGTKVLVKKGSRLDTLESLAGRKVGVIPETTNERVIKIQQPEAELVSVKDRIDGLNKLEQGEIDAFASDGILLEGLKKEAKNPANLEVVPEFPFMYESYACIIPQDNSAWRDTVNYSLIKFMEGVVGDRLAAVSIYEKWFGTEGVTPSSRDAVNDYFQGIVDSYEWIPLVGD